MVPDHVLIEKRKHSEKDPPGLRAKKRFKAVTMLLQSMEKVFANTPTNN
jgi:hypothetical protein